MLTESQGKVLGEGGNDTTGCLCLLSPLQLSMWKHIAYLPSKSFTFPHETRHVSSTFIYGMAGKRNKTVVLFGSYLALESGLNPSFAT